MIPIIPYSHYYWVGGPPKISRCAGGVAVATRQYAGFQETSLKTFRSAGPGWKFGKYTFKTSHVGRTIITGCCV